jgi:hypothetical protein
MSSLADAARSGRVALAITLTHSATLTPITDGVVDAHNNAVETPGTPVTIACRFETRQQAVRDATGITLVTVPALSVSATQAIAIGDQISAVLDQDGNTPPGAGGTFRVDRVLDDTAGLGVAMLPVYGLRSAAPVR